MVQKQHMQLYMYMYTPVRVCVAHKLRRKGLQLCPSDCDISVDRRSVCVSGCSFTEDSLYSASKNQPMPKIKKKKKTKVSAFRHAGLYAVCHIFVLFSQIYLFLLKATILSHVNDYLALLCVCMCGKGLNNFAKN